VRRALVALAVAFLIAGPLRGQQSPNAVKGLPSNGVFESNEVDQINLFNGSLNLTIPIGQTYKVAGDFSYSFRLTYSSNNWEYNTREVDEYDRNGYLIQHFYAQAYLSGLSNAGVGWLFTLGRLLPPGTHSSQSEYCYESPDGGEHCFEPKLHDSDPTSDSTTSYSRDGTYLRMRIVGTTREIDFPDGTTHVFGSNGMLTLIRDHQNNSLSINYLPSNDSECNAATYWNITDSSGRVSNIYFRQANLGDVLCRADLASFTQPNATQQFTSFRFATTDLPISRLLPNYTEEPDPEIPGNQNATLLTQITLSDGTSYVANVSDYDTGDGVNYAHLNGTPPSYSGNLLRLRLPSLGSMQWDYQRYQYPGESEIYWNDIAGVFKRRRYDALGNLRGVWRYDPRWTYLLTQRELINTVTQRDADDTYAPQDDNPNPYNFKSVNYFSASTSSACVNCYPGEYGMPLTRRTLPGRVNPDGSSPDRYLSSELFDSDGSLLSRTFLRYEGDYTLQYAYFDQKLNQRVVSERTDDANGNSVIVDRSGFDGYGHYRVETKSGFGSSTVRRTTIAYNKPDPLVDSNATPNSGTFPGSFSQMAPASPWILGMFTSRLVEDVTGSDTRSAKTLFKFNWGTGFLERQRIIAAGMASSNQQPSVGTNDVIVRYTSSNGNVASEEYFGGDAASHALDITQPLASTPLGTAEYRFDSTYLAGIRTAAQPYDMSGGTAVAMPFLSTDNTVDPRTGAIVSQRDVSGIGTTFTYDGSGRTSTISPDSRAATTFTYTNPSVSGSTFTPSTTHVSTAASNGAVETEKQRDSFGMPWRERMKRSNGVWATRETLYDTRGRRTSLSEWENTTSPTHVTTFTYDALGRITSATTPDGQSSTVSYSGSASVVRTTNVYMNHDPNPPSMSPATTTETYDFLGHLRTVTDPNGIVTTYDYDPLDHLTHVCMNVPNGVCGQERNFLYDGRGLLLSEVLPESGSTVYTYDSRGHWLTKRVNNANDVFDLNYYRDGAERLVRVDSRNPYYPTQFRVSKQWIFGTSSSYGNYALGKVVTAIRHNYIPSVGDMTVTQSYTYGDAGGGATDRTTTIANATYGTQIKTVTQTQFWSDIGVPSTIVYPSCTGCGAAPWGTLVSTYTNGGLTSVGGFAGSITYDAGGGLSTVSHTNNVTDTYTTDTTTMMSRPKSISFNNWTSCTAPSIYGQPQGGTVPTNGSRTMYVYANGTDLQYQWYDGSPSNPISGATGYGYTTPPLSASHTYAVRVSNSCGMQESYWVTVSICNPATVTSPQSQTITAGQSVTLSVTGSGTAPLTYQWYQGVPPNGTAVGTNSSQYTTPPLYATTSYYVTAANSCGSASATATLSLALPAPSSLAATAAGTSATISWGAVSGANHYELERRSNGGGFAKVQDVYGTSWTNSGLVYGTAYVYRARAVDSGGGVGAYSNNDVATAMSFTPITAYSTGVAGAHLTELLNAVNAVRAANGWAAVSWSQILSPSTAAPATGAYIWAEHITALRTTLDQALTALGIATQSYTDPTPSFIRAVHINDIRNRLQ
jgi:YD repeat-containing protein